MKNDSDRDWDHKSVEDKLRELRRRFDALKLDDGSFLTRLANLPLDDVPEDVFVAYCVSLVGNRPPTAKEIEYGRSLAPLAKECLVNSRRTRPPPEPDTVLFRWGLFCRRLPHR